MKSKLLTAGLVIVAGISVVVLVGPFLVPVPPLKGTLPPEALADEDSQFIEINDVKTHVKTKGLGEPVFILLHGFGASLYSWQAVMEPLSQMGRVIAYDRPAFGLTERPLTWDGQNPYSPEAQVDSVIGLLDHYGIGQAILVGNSAGGTIAMQTALAHPERVSALVLVDPSVYSDGGARSWLRPLLATPQMRRLGPLAVRQIQKRGTEMLKLAWHNPALLKSEIVELYQKPLQVDNWDKALWEFTLASRPGRFEQRLGELNLPTLVITGDDDRIVPTEQSIRLAGELPNADLVVIPDTGHVPHEERPDQFLQAVKAFLDSLPQN